MNLFELFVKIGVDDQASKKIQDLSSKLGSGLMTAAKVGTTAAIAGITALTTYAAKNYAEYEQLVGGVETLFKNSANEVQKYADMAYKTAGLSANDYMSTVTSFSASLLQSLGGDTERAAKYADRAVIDMADNANKMGTSIEMIQNAYQGFAKQNYTMLDNLKLGYGGTKTEMERLLADAEKISGMEFDISSFADVTEAIHIIQENMGIAGTTATEAEETIQGSLLAAKAAFMNFTVGIADENANVEELLNQLVESVVIAGENIIPRVGEILGNIVTLLVENAPIMLEQGISQLANFLTGLENKAPDIIDNMAELVINMAGALLRSAPRLLGAAANLLAQLLQQVVNLALNVGKQFVDSVYSGAKSILGKLVDGALSWGRDMVQGFKDGIMDKMNSLLDSVRSLASKIRSYLHFSRPDVGPLRDYETWMPDFMEGLAKGIRSNQYKVTDAIYDLTKDMNMSNMDFGTATVNATASYDGLNGKFGGNGVIGKTVSVVQNIYSKAQTAADLMEEAIYNQEKAVLLSV